eukprot:Phypoly_transcript_21624.p1 GENE.Phypoly_transcript_21624~~Phypoly_transcript_21624.p1  ORF type:complete len:118 (+),score=2.99 Phypoly_transcript_21624:116-469(+)
MPKIPLQNYITSDLRWNFTCGNLALGSIPCAFYTTPGALAVGANFISNIYCSNSTYHSSTNVQAQKFTFSSTTTFQAVNIALPTYCQGPNLDIYANVSMVSLSTGITQLVLPTFQVK